MKMVLRMHMLLLLSLAMALPAAGQQPPAEGGWFPEERIDVETALRAYTANNAWVAGEEAYKGKLQPGFLADIAVLDRNPFEVEPLELKDILVVLTIVDGRVIFERPRS